MTFDMVEIQSCVAEGGIFGMVIPPVVLALFLLELLWLGTLVIRELKRRSDLARIRDLVIEGSVGQAILFADQKGKDWVLSVCRAGIVAVQSNGSLEEAAEKVEEETRRRFRRGLLVPALLFLGALVLAPFGLSVASQVYARQVVEAAKVHVPEGERSALDEAAESDPAVVCPPRLGASGVAVLAPAAVTILLLAWSRVSHRTRAASVQRALQLAEMAARVTSHRAYRDRGEAARA